MSKQTVQVIIGQAVQLTAPGMLGRRFDFSPGHAFLTQEWHYPGEPDETDLQGRRTGDQWIFGTNTGTDLPLTFAADDIREVIISNGPETIKIFKDAPFKVTVQK